MTEHTVDNPAKLPRLKFPCQTVLKDSYVKERQAEIVKLKKVNHQLHKEKRIAKIMFWCCTPFFFAAFMRFFYIIFKYIYGTFLLLILGKKFADIITVIAIITSLFFTLAVCSLLWKEYKKHILEIG